ncbi:response regulator [Mangrovivirga sp. M17]|uniref:Response regulator n=1 Tax=Mangrovivirga halotolerans TaxID=2993936 RepID=A0ABT3RUP2_9BACT|nr:response regulator [Mangrovivirga halotolerans]MCX2745490.1 response regulator [Mangrovivirga halotolerans]
MSKILLVEDDEVTNFLSKSVLKSAGFEKIDEALNGMEAYERIQIECPDIIFLDINMPVMDGWEFLEEKKEKAQCENVKIIMLTSSPHPADKKKARSYPCVIEYFEKPLTNEKVEKLKTMI